MNSFGKKGGESPNRGKKATTYLVTLPDGKIANKRDYNPPADPVGYAYQLIDGTWRVAAVAEKDDERFATYVACPAKAGG